jgi:hypothetical protein
LDVEEAADAESEVHVDGSASFEMRLNSYDESRVVSKWNAEIES